MDGKAAAQYQAGTSIEHRSEGKGDHVRHVFEDASHYLKSRRVDICFRIDTIRTYATPLQPERMLDIGCGDGSISLQLLNPKSQLTLMDLSSNMLAKAEANIPDGLTDRVILRNENFAEAQFGSNTFDLIIAVGVLAHVDSPDEFLQKIKLLLSPGGKLIVELTDAFHFVGWLGRCWSWLKEFIAPAKYSTNKHSFTEIEKLFERHQLKLTSVFRYSRAPIPGFNLLVSHAKEYELVKAFFGNCKNNHNAWLGNEYICLLSSD